MPWVILKTSKGFWPPLPENVLASPLSPISPVVNNSFAKSVLRRVPDSGWLLQETVIPCCPNTRYSYVEYTLYLRRRYTFYVMNSVVVHVLRNKRRRRTHSTWWTWLFRAFCSRCSSWSASVCRRTPDKNTFIRGKVNYARTSKLMRFMVFRRNAGQVFVSCI